MYNVKYVSIKVSLWRILVYLVCPQHLTCPIRKWRSCTQFFFSSLICHILFFWGRLIQIRGLVFAANRSESGDMDSNPAGCWNSLLLPCRFAWHWERQWSEIARLYIAVLSIILFSWILSAAISRWKGLTLNLNIQLPLFWSTWSQARGPTLPHVWAWRIGSDYNCCIASKQSRVKWLVIVCPWLVENTEKSMAHINCFPTLVSWTGNYPRFTTKNAQ